MRDLPELAPDQRRCRSGRDQRIFTASRQGDLAKVRNLQKLMLRSLSNTLVGVRRVMQVNKGRATPGVAGQVVLTGPGKVALRFLASVTRRTSAPAESACRCTLPSPRLRT